MVCHCRYLLGAGGCAVSGHTPGPWGVFAQPIADRGDAVLELVEQVQATSSIASFMYLIDANGKCPAIAGCGPTSAANADRIVACVNALEGMNPDAVAQLVEAAKSVVCDAEQFGILDAGTPEGEPLPSLIVSAEPVRELRAALTNLTGADQ